MKNWKWRTSKKFDGCRGGGFAFEGHLLYFRIYNKGFPSSTSKYYTLELKRPGKDGTLLTGDWIVVQGFSMKEVFKALRKEIKDNKWNTLE